MGIRYSPQHPPSRDKRYVTCDICGFKFHKKDTIAVGDKYNRDFGLIVCKSDYSPTNVQDTPFNFKPEVILAEPSYVRPRVPPNYILNSNDSRLPSAPLNCKALADPFLPIIDLYWDGPSDNGSSGVIGYMVQRASPQLSTYVTIASNTNTSAGYYTDSTANINTYYSYRVAAINTFGVGPYSVDFYWPSDNNIWHDINYLALSQDTTQILSTSSGIPIRLNHTEVGVV